MKISQALQQGRHQGIWGALPAPTLPLGLSLWSAWKFLWWSWSCSSTSGSSPWLTCTCSTSLSRTCSSCSHSLLGLLRCRPVGVWPWPLQAHFLDIPGGLLQRHLLHHTHEHRQVPGHRARRLLPESRTLTYGVITSVATGLWLCSPPPRPPVQYVLHWAQPHLLQNQVLFQLHEVEGAELPGDQHPGAGDPLWESCCSATPWSLGPLQHCKNEKKNKAVKMIFAVVVLFLGFWTPYNVVLFLETLVELEVLQDCTFERHLDYAIQTTETLALFTAASILSFTFSWGRISQVHRTALQNLPRHSGALPILSTAPNVHRHPQLILHAVHGGPWSPRCSVETGNARNS